ncbi:DNA polymerase III subunit chi [Neisseria arctica]|uniref:DNA polymerase III subunit chi n=1 Tax=Neisseria arctica TaxID=1470200 RepID=A0A0J1C542_9NEIS|nr:DNA polymerase III subunit chi [Neisseria arctica]KLT73408.1 DNA polymerase III subunit chi [Neisseria arctica]UOO86063.1 DNA polymerase III subunit chi [Neisseria arctica]
MPKATFYTHVADPADFACRLAQRALQNSNSILIWTDTETAAAKLDIDLWRFNATSFLPHEIWHDGTYPEDVPIVISSGNQLPKQTTAEVVLNLSAAFWCDTRPQPSRVLEIVGTSLEELADARERFKAYKQSGFEIEHHNMQNKA